jgi:hypothetical protein
MGAQAKWRTQGEPRGGNGRSAPMRHHPHVHPLQHRACLWAHPIAHLLVLMLPI